MRIGSYLRLQCYFLELLECSARNHSAQPVEIDVVSAAPYLAIDALVQLLLRVLPFQFAVGHFCPALIQDLPLVFIAQLSHACIHDVCHRYLPLF